MSPRKRPEPDDPILILAPEDYGRLSKEEPAPPGPAPRPRPPRQSRRVVIGLLLVVIIVAAGVQVDWSGLRLKPEPSLAVRIPRRIPKAVEAPPPAAAPAVLPPPDIEPEEPPAPVPPPVTLEARPPWNGGRVWVRLRLRTEHRLRIEESEHRVILVWTGSQFVLERRPSDRADAAMDRLELLLHLPCEDGSWRRQITATGAEAITVRAGELACRRVDGEDRFPQGSRRFRYWYSEEFPAGAVQAEQTVGEFTFVARVVDFGAEERKGER